MTNCLLSRIVQMLRMSFNMPRNAIQRRITYILTNLFYTFWSCANGLHSLFYTSVIYFLTPVLTRQIQAPCHRLHNHIQLDHTSMCLVCKTIRIRWAIISISQSSRKAWLDCTASYYIWILLERPLPRDVFGTPKRVVSFIR